MVNTNSSSHSITYGDISHDHTYSDLSHTHDVGTFVTHAGVELWEHRISITQYSITCAYCEMTYDIPELLQLSDGFREVVYKIHILSKFRESSCYNSVEPPFDSTEPHNVKIPWDYSDITIDNSTVTVQQPGATFKTSDGKEYTITNTGECIDRYGNTVSVSSLTTK